MTEVTRVVEAPAARVWDVLADGWTYAGWVVGASHVRRVDAGWPAVGTRVHHSVGTWPLTLDDTTEVTSLDRGRRIERAARAWPTGQASVRFDLEPLTARTTLVRMVERARRGPARLLPDRAQDLLLVPRNAETLARLADLALRRTGD